MYWPKSALRGTGWTSLSTTRTATWVCPGALSLTLTAMSSSSLRGHRGRQAEAVERVGVLPEDLPALLVRQVRRDGARFGHVPVRVARAEQQHVGLARHLGPLSVRLGLAEAVEAALHEVD